MTRTQRRRVAVIGLDGATFDLIQPWARDGYLPTLQKLMAEGAWGPLRTVIPPLTGPAWISFMTGKNPGQHGIYDFVARAAGSYTGVPVNASQRAGQSLWMLLSRAGRRVGTLMVPVTYPPEPVNGWMVTGMMTPASATDYCHPLELVEELQAAVPEFTLTPEGTAHPLGREHELVAGLDRMTAMTRKSIRYLLDRDGDLDLFMVVFKEPDVAMHWLWRFMDPAHPWHVPDAAESLVHGIRDTYVRLDAAVGELLERLTVGGEPPLVILMSDHGAGSQETYFHVNTWLVAQGLMRLRRDPLTALKRLAYRLGVTPVALYRLTMALGQGRQVARTLSTRRRSALSLLRAAFLSFDNVDWQRTRVYSLGNYGQLYVNLKGREPQGMVNPGTDYERVIDELVGRLETLVDPRTGARIRGTAHRKEDIYSGAHLAEAPDLVFIPDDMRYNSFGQFQFSSRRWLEPTFDRSGGHRMDGICLLWGPGVQPGRLDDAHITDLAPTALAALGVPIPDDLDGRVLRAAFEPGYWDATPIRYTQPDELPLRDRVEYGAQEEEELREHLRGLGYMA